MARLCRFYLPDYPQHVIVRGNNRVDIFRDDGDRLFYLRQLCVAARRHGCAIHAYVLMSNHVHLLLSPASATSIAGTVQSVGRSYVQVFNRRYERTGTLWDGRYRATLIDSDAYLFACMHYIELNPVRAGIVSEPARFRWSSYRRNAMGIADDLVTAHPLWLDLARDDRDRYNAYRQLFERPLSPRTIEEIRDATNKRWVLGDDAFRSTIQDRLGGRRAGPLPRGGDRKSEGFRISQISMESDPTDFIAPPSPAR
jgi:putative transposase